MKTIDLVHETYIALAANKVRSGLTMLGIVIGIGSVIAMVSIGQGAQSSISARIQGIGSNLIMVTPGAQRGPGFQVSTGRGNAKTLTMEDVDTIGTTLQNVKAVAPEVSGRYQVTAKGTNTNTTVTGVTSTYAGVRNSNIDTGSFITDSHVQSAARIAVIGPTTRDDLFGEGSDPIGSAIRIKNIEFKIIGVLQSKGSSGFGNADDLVLIPLSTAQHYLSGDQYVTTISVAASDAGGMTQLQQDITDALMNKHHITDETKVDFSTMNQADIVATASSVTQTFTILLAAIAGISLVVGGIGIMNMMLTTVTERTKEIGLRKAIGARRRDINIQFLAESIALTFVGGVIGVIVGWLIAFAVNYSGVLQTSVTLSSVLLAFGVSAAIGIIFGYYPARHAASLNPIDALRYE